MLKVLSHQVFASTSGLCRVSLILPKSLSHVKFSAYSGKGITYDEDSVYEEQPSNRNRFRESFTKRRQDYQVDHTENDQYHQNNRYSRNAFNNRRQVRDFEGSGYEGRNSFDNTESDQYHQHNRYNRNEFNKRRQFRDFEDSGYGGRNSFRNQSFQKSNQSFGQRLVEPVFEDLKPIEKYFYVEHPAVAVRSTEEVESYRKRSNITVSGSDIPNPVLNFDELCLPESLSKVVAKQEYSEPTPIQAQGWPIALSGRDMVGISQTGSGKTLVFVLPAIIHALNQLQSKRDDYGCKPQVLILAPTRELVQQIQSVSDRFSYSCNLLSSSAYGGASRHYQLRNLAGAHICVATPGRLIDFVSEGSVDLRQCSYLVLDEADRMLDMGFEPQIRQIVGQTRPDRQTLMWSATWPREIQNLAEDFLKDYVQVTVGAGELVANPKIKQNIYVVHEREKDRRLLSLIEEAEEKNKKVLVFAQTKRKVDDLGRYFKSLGKRVLCIHGDVSQSRRDEVLHIFRNKSSSVLIATDVAARGLDITDIQYVVNYDFPLNIEDYIHRIGRTARGDASGEAHSFLTEENYGIVKDLVSVLEQANQDVPEELLSLYENRQRNTKKRPFGLNRSRNFRFQQSAF